MKRYYRLTGLILADIICVNVSYILALLLRYNFDINTGVFKSILQTYESNLLIITIISCLLIAAFRGYRTYIRYMQPEDLLGLMAAMIIGQPIISLIVRARGGFMSGSIYMMAFFIGFVLISSVRILPKNIFSIGKRSLIRAKITGNDSDNKEHIKRIMVVGANSEAASFIIATNRNELFPKRVVVVVDDNPSKRGLHICGARIVHGVDKIRQAARKYRVEEIFIAVPKVNESKMAFIADECAKTKCKTVILPKVEDLFENKSKIKDTVPDVHKLLNRPAVEVDKRLQAGYVEGKIIMVIGAAGSVGEQLAKDLVKLKPRRLLLVDINKRELEALMNNIKIIDDSTEVEAVFCTVSRTELMKEVFEHYKPHIVYFAAACGDSSTVKTNEKQAILVNLKGAVNAMELSHANSVERFVLVSDMDAFEMDSMSKMTSRLAQLFAQEYSMNSDTKFIVVCIGKVLDTNSGFLRAIIHQVKSGIPVESPPGDAMAHFIPVDDAGHLIIDAGRLGDGGEVFCVNMSSAINLKELTEKTVKMLGLMPYAEVDIHVGASNCYSESMGERGVDPRYLTKTANNSIYRYDFIEESEEVVRLLRKKDGSGEFEPFVEKLISEDKENIEAWLKKALCQ